MKLTHDQRGQASALTALYLVALLGMAALVLDIGSWFRQDRQLQATADAAALAGVQELPESRGLADSFAQSYANKNTAGLTEVKVQFSSKLEPDDTIRVTVAKPAPGFFAKIFGIDSVAVDATAVARTGGMKSAKYVAPIVVRNTHPMLTGTGCGNSGGPCLGPDYETTIPVGSTGAPGAFALLNLLGGGSGTASASELADWIVNGFDQELPLGGYYSSPGVKFNSHGIQAALDVRRDSVNPIMLFPVYDTLSGQGANAEYHIIGWVPFYILDFEAKGTGGSITGYFTDVVWNGTLANTSGGGGPNYGARAVQLVE